jgi:hypothetical protein
LFRKRGLLHGGAKADAEVVRVATRSLGPGPETPSSLAHLVLTLRVRLADGSTVEVEREVGGIHNRYFVAVAGDVLPVRYDPKDPSKLEIDWPALDARRGEWKADVAELAARQAREDDSSNPKADLIRISIVQAKRKGDAAEVERLTAMLADLEHGSASGPTPE